MSKEGRTKGNLGVTIDQKLLDDFSQHIEQEKKNKSAVVESLIQEYMNKLKKGK